MQNHERNLFELYIRSIDPINANDRLLRHTDETWWGSDETRPMYRVVWTESLWLGWKARASLVEAGKGAE